MSDPTYVLFYVANPTRSAAFYADLLGKQNPFAPAIMPERLANADPTSAVKEIIGSGPYRYMQDQRIQGARNVYRKFDKYKPRETGTPEETPWQAMEALPDTTAGLQLTWCRRN
mgnify:CR=1 FL=1